MEDVKVSVNGKELSQQATDMLLGKERIDSGIEVRGASIKEDICTYSYDITEGKCEGDKVTNRKGSNVIHDDMKLAFQALHPHIAVICEEVEISPELDIKSIQKFDADVHKEGSLEHKISHFTVSGFKITGGGDNESLVLIGEKRLSTGDHVGLTTPKINLDDYPYSFIADLRAAVNNCILEVEEYMNGKCAPKLEQSAMDFGENGNEGEEGEEETGDEE